MNQLAQAQHTARRLVDCMQDWANRWHVPDPELGGVRSAGSTQAYMRGFDDAQRHVHWLLVLEGACLDFIDAHARTRDDEAAAIREVWSLLGGAAIGSTRRYQIGGPIPPLYPGPGVVSYTQKDNYTGLDGLQKYVCLLFTRCATCHTFYVPTTIDSFPEWRRPGPSRAWRGTGSDWCTHEGPAEVWDGSAWAPSRMEYA